MSKRKTSRVESDSSDEDFFNLKPKAKISVLNSDEAERAAGSGTQPRAPTKSSKSATQSRGKSGSPKTTSGPDRNKQASKLDGSSKVDATVSLDVLADVVPKEQAWKLGVGAAKNKDAQLAVRDVNRAEQLQRLQVDEDDRVLVEISTLKSQTLSSSGLQPTKEQRRKHNILALAVDARVAQLENERKDRRKNEGLVQRQRQYGL